MKLHVYGTIFGNSGYDIHTRNLVNALYNEGIDIVLECNLPENWVRYVNDNELKMITNNKENVDYILLVTLPSVTPLFLCKNIPVIQYVVWEGDKIPNNWIEPLLKCKYVIVPSLHTKQAIVATLNENKNNKNNRNIDEWIKIIPHGVNTKIFYPKPELKNKEFTFLCDKGFPNGSRDRGGLSFLLKSYLEEFTSKDNVILILKINMAYNFSMEMFNKFLSELNIQNKDMPKLEVIPQNIDYKMLNDIYNRAHVFVIPSLAESFHLGGIQAMACSIPIIYTNFGGQTEYCNKENGWELKDGKMINICWDILYEDVQWKLPDINEMQKTLRYVYENQNEVHVKSTNAYNTALGFTWEISAKKFKEILI